MNFTQTGRETNRAVTPKRGEAILHRGHTRSAILTSRPIVAGIVVLTEISYVSRCATGKLKEMLEEGV